MAETPIESTLQQTIEKLQEENAALRAENEALTAVNDDLTAKLEELGKQPEKPAEKAPELPAETFVVNKKKYRFIAPVFTLNSQRITAEAALKDNNLLAHLVQIKSGAIKEL